MLSQQTASRPVAFRPHLTIGVGFMGIECATPDRIKCPHQEIGLHILRWVTMGVLPRGSSWIGRKYLSYFKPNLRLMSKESNLRSQHFKSPRIIWGITLIAQKSAWGDL